MTENGNITPSLGGLFRQTQRLTSSRSCAALISPLLVGGFILNHCRLLSSSLLSHLKKCGFRPALTSWIAFSALFSLGVSRGLIYQ
jgi:hypothetical protein